MAKEGRGDIEGGCSVAAVAGTGISFALTGPLAVGG